MLRELLKLARDLIAQDAQKERAILPPAAGALPSPAEREFDEAAEGAEGAPPTVKRTWRW